MDPTLNPDASARERAECIRRLRQQVVTGAYEPPIDLLVDRLVSLLVSERTSSPARARSIRRS